MTMGVKALWATAGAAVLAALFMAGMAVSGVSGTEEELDRLGSRIGAAEEHLEKLRRADPAADIARLNSGVASLQVKIGELRDSLVRSTEEAVARRLEATESRLREEFKQALANALAGRPAREGGDEPPGGGPAPRGREARDRVLRQGAGVMAAEWAERAAKEAGLTPEQAEKYSALASTRMREVADVWRKVSAGELDREAARERMRDIWEGFREEREEFMKDLTPEQREKIEESRGGRWRGPGGRRRRARPEEEAEPEEPAEERPDEAF
jgi:hypothetical protein